MSDPREDVRPLESSPELPPEYSEKPPIDEGPRLPYQEFRAYTVTVPGGVTFQHAADLTTVHPDGRTYVSPLRRLFGRMCVTSPGAMMLIPTAFFVMLLNATDGYWLWSSLSFAHIGSEVLLVVLYGAGASLLIVLLLYPALAVAGDARCGNLCLMLAGVIPLALFGLTLIGIMTGIMIGLGLSLEYPPYVYCFLIIGCLSQYLAVGIFETNVFQFARDVLGKAYSHELGSFAHWYYFATRLPVFLGTLTVCIIFVLDTGNDSVDVALLIISMVFVPICCLVLLSSLVVTCVLHGVLWLKGETVQRQIMKNPVKMVCRVTRYALQLPASPTDRNILARFAHARRSNGGLVDDEDVESVAKFWFIVILMASLFGFFFWDDMWAVSLTNFVIGGANDYTFWTMNSQTATAAVATFCVPIYQFFVRPLIGRSTFPKLAGRICIGLILQMISLALVSWNSAVSQSQIDSRSNLCDYTHDGVDDAAYVETQSWEILVIPQVINGFSQLLVFPAVIELILNDAPRVMQGLLIGMWFAMQSIHIFVNIVESSTCAVFYWQYYLMKIVLTLTSLFLFGVAAFFYNRYQGMPHNHVTPMQVESEAVTTT